MTADPGASPSDPVSLVDVYLALAHVGPAEGPLAPLPGEAPEESARVYVAALAGGGWRVWVRPDAPPPAREALLALTPEVLFRNHALVSDLLTRLWDASALGLWVGRTLTFPPDLSEALATGVERLEPDDDFYDQPAPDAAFRRLALRSPNDVPFDRGYPKEQFAIIKGGRVVATCESSRESMLAAEAWVRTAPDARGHGYATRVTAAWALDVRRRGKTPFYSHHLDNAASAGVARALGLIPFLEDVGYL